MVRGSERIDSLHANPVFVGGKTQLLCHSRSIVPQERQLVEIVVQVQAVEFFRAKFAAESGRFFEATGGKQSAENVAVTKAVPGQQAQACGGLFAGSVELRKVEIDAAEQHRRAGRSEPKARRPGGSSPNHR